MTDVHDTSPLTIRRDVAGKTVQWRSSLGYEWTHLELPVAGLAPPLAGLRIFHLTDLHCRPWWDPAYDDLIARLRQNPPDLILFTGDFVENKIDARPALPVVVKLFSQLASRLGIFAIPGNHDGDLVGASLADCNLTFVDHRRIHLDAGDSAVELIGLPGVDRFDFDRRWLATLGPKRPGSLRVVLSHYPNLLPKIADLAPDLYLTGHTHGGQICLPNGLPILRHDSLPRELCTGIHRAFGSVLVANRGFGFTTPLMLRLYCPAQVVEITVR
jgi:predicted MPP superfamily phosphohydrolase